MLTRSLLRSFPISTLFFSLLSAGSAEEEVAIDAFPPMNRAYAEPEEEQVPSSEETSGNEEMGESEDDREELPFADSELKSFPATQPLDHEEEGSSDFEWGFTINPDRPNLFLNLNGYAWHLKKGDESEESVNDWPLGLGLTYELQREEKYIWTVDGDIFFVDSNRDFAAALGSTILWRTRFVDLGVRGGLLYKQNFVEDWGVPLAPVILPVFQWDLHYFALKVIYIPGLRKDTDEQFFFQVLIPLGGPR